VECFAAGTLILTPTGERAVELLAVGDAIVTGEGEISTLRWIGRRRLRLAAHPRPDEIRPVRIAAGAFGEALPRRDLVLSPGHGVFIENRLIPAGCLVNGRTITRPERAEVEYFHLEFDRHEIVLAEGLQTESYLDCGNRGDFESEAGVVNLHPTFTALSHEAGVAPFVIAGPMLDAVRARLERRADEIDAAAAPPFGWLAPAILRLWKRRRRSS
jgi:hypothetical protein